MSNKSNRIEKPSEIDICKDNLSASVLSGNGETLSSVTPDQQHIPRKNKINNDAPMLKYHQK